MRARALLCLALCMSAVGCITTERIPSAMVRVEDEDGNVEYRQTRRLEVAGAGTNQSERELQRAAAQRPRDPTVWWNLGELYDRLDRQADALRAFLRLQKILKELGSHEGHDYLEGDYFVGRTYALLGDWAESRRWLRLVLTREPSSRWMAARSPWWRESHFLLGSIDYAHEAWAEAEIHLKRYERLTGDTVRAAGMLARIERELYPERLSSNMAQVR
ncbi:MAG: hypothetical protein JKY65_07680 [Planctomycetes bacterium]|nr:hypothetical protein [Planctomycetota bacterium]